MFENKPVAYREKPAYGITKRLRRKLLSLFNRWNRKGYDVRYVFINEKQYKKVIYHTESRADRVRADLEAFGPGPHFPAVIGQRRSALLVEFIPDRVIGHVDTRTLPLLADFYAAVYKRAPRQTALRKTPLWHELTRDLRFLRDVKVLSEQRFRELIDHSDEIAPATVWFGFDYSDPTTANLVLRKDENVVCAIDIKNLYSNTLIGGGVAKARSRWLTDALTDAFFERLDKNGAPDFRGYLPFLEILNQIRRAKHILLKGRTHALRADEFNQRLGQLIGQTRAACREQTQRVSGADRSSLSAPPVGRHSRHESA